MNRRWILAAFLAVCAAQLAVPALMIRTYEDTLARGRAFKVRCEPLDLAHAFRGRYVRLTLELPAPEGYEPAGIRWGQRVWAILEDGPDGFARAASIHETRPPEGDVIPVRYSGGTLDRERNLPGEPRFRLHLDRYYVGEILAPGAERAFRDQAEGARRDHADRVGPDQDGKPGLKAHATVRVLDGVAAIEALHVAGMPIEEYMALPPDQRERLATEPEARAP